MERIFKSCLACLLSFVSLPLFALYQPTPAGQPMMQPSYMQPGMMPRQQMAMGDVYNPMAAGPSSAELPGGPSGMPELSESDLQFLNELDNMIQNLSPEEKQQLDEMTNNMSKHIDEMLAQDPSLQQRIQDDPAELEKFLNSVITPEIERLESSAVQPVTPEPVIEEKKPAKEEPKKESINVDEKIAILDSLIDLIDAFEEKTEDVPRFSEQYEKWVKDRRITYGEEAPTWKQFKEKVGVLKQTLHQLEQEEDPAAKIKKYKHIENLVADKESWQQLETIEEKLHRSVPEIKKERSKGLKDLSSSGKKAARESLSAILAGIHVQSKLEEVLKKYEKRAGELRAEEKKRQEVALAESKKTRATRPTTVIGRGGREEYPNYMPDGSYPRGGMYPWEQGAPSQPWKPEAAEKGGKPSEGKDQKGKPKGPSKAKSGKRSDEEKALDNAVQAIIDKLGQIQSIIEDNDELQNFGMFMMSDQAVEDKTVAQSIKEIDDLLATAAHDVKRVVTPDIKRVNEAVKKEAIKELNDALASQENRLLASLASSINGIANSPTAVKNEKRRYYFLGEQRKRLERELEQKKATAAENLRKEQEKFARDVENLNAQIAREQSSDQQRKKHKDALEKLLKKEPKAKPIDAKLEELAHQEGAISADAIPAHYEQLKNAINDLAKVKQRASARKKELSRQRPAMPELSKGDAE